jgi:hypothetical protein
VLSMSTTQPIKLGFRVHESPPTIRELFLGVYTLCWPHSPPELSGPVYKATGDPETSISLVGAHPQNGNHLESTILGGGQQKKSDGTSSGDIEE